MEDRGALLCTWWPQAMRAQPWPLAQRGGTVGFSMELVTPLPWPHAMDQRGGHGAAATCRERRLPRRIHLHRSFHSKGGRITMKLYFSHEPPPTVLCSEVNCK